MNRYDLKKRPPLFLPGCKIKLSKEGLAHVRRMCKQAGGLTTKWYRDRVGRIISMNEAVYLVVWESNLDPTYRSSAQRWHDSIHFVHYRPRKKSE